MKKLRYGVRGGRIITRDGQAWMAVNPHGTGSPTEADKLVYIIAGVFNILEVGDPNRNDIVNTPMFAGLRQQLIESGEEPR